MLIGEAARLKDISNAASAAFAVVLKTRDARSGAHLIRYLDNQESYLAKRRELSAAQHAEIARIRARFGVPIKPEDF